MKPTYVGTDLLAMSYAENYHHWILEQFRPFLGKRLVEVGAGTGNFSELLISLSPDYLALVEPSMLVEKLRTRFAKSEFSQVRFFDSLFCEASRDIRRFDPDSIIYVNVLEHVEDDRKELEAVSDTLQTGGRIFIFVLAHQWLYGEFDRTVGHFRRYSRTELEGICTAAGFRIALSKYFDFAGIVPWWIKYRLIKSSNLTPKSVRLYDKYVVPITRFLDRVSTAPTGKNILLIGEKR